MEKYKVSVVVPVYNVEKYLRQCLDSIVNQTLKDIEIIVVNDGSKDSSLEIMQEYAAKDKRVVIIDKPNSGYGNSMNCGFDRATGEYIGIVESDDYIDLDMYENLYKTAKEEDAEVVKSNFFLYWSGIEEESKFNAVVPYEQCGKVFSPSTDLRGMKQVAYWNAQPSIWSAIYKRDFIRKNNIRFNETPGASYQDASFIFKVWACAKRVFCVYAAYLHYRQDNPNSSVNTSGKVYCICDEYDEMIRFIEADPSRAHLFPLMNRIRFDSYMWNMDRIAPESVPEFASRMNKDFCEAAQKGQINKRMFEPWKWETLKTISSTPAVFVKQHLRDRQMEGVNTKLDEMNRKLNSIDETIASSKKNVSVKNPTVFTKLKKKFRTFLYTLRHEGLRGVNRKVKENIHRMRGEH